MLLPAEDDGSRTDPLLGQNMVTSAQYEPDFDALGSASTRIVPAAGEESDGIHAGGLPTARASHARRGRPRQTGSPGNLTPKRSTSSGTLSGCISSS